MRALQRLRTPLLPQPGRAHSNSLDGAAALGPSFYTSSTPFLAVLRPEPRTSPSCETAALTLLMTSAGCSSSQGLLSRSQKTCTRAELLWRRGAAWCWCHITGRELHACQALQAREQRAQTRVTELLSSMVRQLIVLA